MSDPGKTAAWIIHLLRAQGRKKKNNFFLKTLDKVIGKIVTSKNPRSLGLEQARGRGLKSSGDIWQGARGRKAAGIREGESGRGLEAGAALEPPCWGA